MNFRAGGRRRRFDVVIDITSLVDVVFQLLIFLVITTTYKKDEHAFAIDLPTATETDLIVSVQEDRPTVFIGREGELFFLSLPDEADPAALAAAGQPITAEQLEERLRALAAARPDVELSVKAQLDTPYQRFIDVMNLARKVGLKNVILPYELVPADGGGPAPGAAPPEP
jgi:biopolymer transport protein ExbD